MDRINFDYLSDLHEKYFSLKKMESDFIFLKQEVINKNLQIRKEKVDFLKNSLDKIEKEINVCEEEIQNIRYRYCAIKGHTYLPAVICEGFSEVKTHCCIYCGHSFNDKEKEFFSENEFAYLIDKTAIADECYKSGNFSNFGFSIEDILHRLIGLYENYYTIKELLMKICQIFGHELISEHSDIKTYKCQCCGERFYHDFDKLKLNTERMIMPLTIQKNIEIFTDFEEIKLSELDILRDYNWVLSSGNKFNDIEMVTKLGKFVNGEFICDVDKSSDIDNFRKDGFIKIKRI